MYIHSLINVFRFPSLGEARSRLRTLGAFISSIEDSRDISGTISIIPTPHPCMHLSVLRMLHSRRALRRRPFRTLSCSSVFCFSRVSKMNMDSFTQWVCFRYATYDVMMLCYERINRGFCWRGIVFCNSICRNYLGWGPTIDFKCSF